MSQMAEHKVRLVYCSTLEHAGAEKPLDFGNARQLSLFDDFCRLRILFLPVADVSPHRFMRALDESHPYLVIDTRDFPDFYAVFPSTERALDEFQRRGISYNRVPLQGAHDGETLWGHFSILKSIFSDYIERKTNAPVLVLCSTRQKSERVSQRLIGYIAQEISEVTLEKIPL